MNVLTVIPCLNEAKNLDALLTQLLADPTIDLLVVADGGSDDGSQGIVERFVGADPRVRLLNNPARIQSAGVNLAVQTYGAGYKWLLRVDAHCRYPDGYASTLLAAANRHDATAVVVPMITRASAGFGRAAAAAQNSILGTGGSAHRHVGKGAFVEHGHHALMRLDEFRRAGGYCEAMACNEDAELDHRQTSLGGRIWLEPSATIVYFPRSTARGLWRQYFKYGVGRARNLRRHRMRPRLRQMVPLAVPLAIVLAVAFPLHWIFAMPVCAWATLSLGLGLVVGARAGGGWAYAAGAAAAIMHLAWASGFIIEMIAHPKGVAPRYGLAVIHAIPTLE